MFLYLQLTDSKSVLALPPPPDQAWMFGIHATNIPDNLSVEKKVVWFLCPWIPRIQDALVIVVRMMTQYLICFKTFLMHNMAV